MRRCFFALMLTVLLVAGACGGKKAGPGKGAHGKAVAAKSVLKAVTIEPAQPTVAHLVRALPRFDPPPRSAVRLLYRWFVNGEQVEGVTGPLLPREFYKRGDRITCRARPAAGGREIRAAAVTVANAAPEFRTRPVAPFPVPGEFFHQVFAADPDGDPVSYHLVSPLDRKIRLDEKTGIVRWRVQAPPPAPPQPPRTSADRAREEEESAPVAMRVPADSPLPEESPSTSVLLVFEARDGHGGVTRQTLVLDLARGGEVISVD